MKLDNENKMSPSIRLALAPNVMLQPLGDEEGGVLLKLDSGEMYTINDTVVAFLQELDGKRSIADVARRLVEQFDVEEHVLIDDLVEVSRDLASQSLVAGST